MDPQDQNPTPDSQNDNLKQQYQDILNKYAQQIKPEDSTTPAPPSVPSPEVSEVPDATETAVETPALPPESSPESIEPATTPSTEALEEILNQPIPPQDQPQPEIQPGLPPPPPSAPEASPEFSPPTPTPPPEPPPVQPQDPPPSAFTPPENQLSQPSSTNSPEVEAKLSSILNDSDSDKPKASKFPKIFFIISLLIFLGVVGAIAFNLIKDQSSTLPDIKADPTIVSDISPTQQSTNTVGCTLNDQTYAVNQSFQAADGCNTCTCQSDGTIACTEMACELTPSESTSSSLPDTGSEVEMADE